jgi:quercetin dioxygenase-like cupin family protein
MIAITFAFVALFALVLAAPGISHAQNGTPPATSAVKVEVLGKDQSAVAPDRTLLLQRRTFPAGSDTGAHAAAGPVVLYVESGSVVFTVVQGSALVTRAGSTATEAVSANSSVTLNMGDSVSYDQGVIHDVKNAGTTAAVTLEARLNPPTAATPAATPA